MTETGIVRRIDDLGRVVLPKELRNSLRLGDGEAVEIFVHDKMICLRKYSPLKSFIRESQVAMNSFGKKKDVNIVITDKDFVIASQIEDYLEKPLSSEFMDVISEKRKGQIKVPLTNRDKGKTEYIVPIVANNEVIGSIAAVDSLKITKEDCAIIDYIASLLGRANESTLI